MSQLDLALTASISPRHLSFLESGRAQPSREMVRTLGDALDVPLREQNRLLRAAGFVEHYRETDLASPEFASVRQALEFLIARHEPYPALVMNASWTVLLANQSASRLMVHFGGAGFAASLSRGELPNLVRQLFNKQDGAGQYVTNWNEVARSMFQRVRQEALATGGDAGVAVAALARELGSNPDVPAEWRAGDDLLEPLLPVVPVKLEKDDLRLNLFSTISTFGTPLDITLQEIRLETFFPLDAETEATLRQLGAGSP